MKVYFWVDVEKTSVLKMSSVLMRNITTAFLDADISMPDDARERIFPQGLRVETAPNQGEVDEDGKVSESNDASNDSEGEASSSSSNQAKHNHNVVQNSRFSDDDVASEAHEIREQARNSRDPEGGENIL